jgi:hypothetical protein
VKYYGFFRPEITISIRLLTRYENNHSLRSRIIYRFLLEESTSKLVFSFFHNICANTNPFPEGVPTLIFLGQSNHNGLDLRPDLHYCAAPCLDIAHGGNFNRPGNHSPAVYTGQLVESFPLFLPALLPLKHKVLTYS